MSPSEPSDEVAITLPRASWLRVVALLGGVKGEEQREALSLCGLVWSACRPGCENGHGPEERFVRPNGELRCHACQRAAGARQRAKERG